MHHVFWVPKLAGAHPNPKKDLHVTRASKEHSPEEKQGLRLPLRS
jgi:hypothetical protein